MVGPAEVESGLDSGDKPPEPTPSALASYWLAVVVYTLALFITACVALIDWLGLDSCGWDYPDGWQSTVAKWIWPAVFLAWILGFVLMTRARKSPQRGRRKTMIITGWLAVAFVAFYIVNSFLDRVPHHASGCLP